MSDRFERFALAVMMISAIGIASTLVHREFFGSPRPSTQAPELNPRWPAVRPAGRVFGDSSATIDIVVFSDLECPFCRKWHATARAVMADRQDVKMTFVHFPLPGHRFAIPAARAATCADVEGKLPDFVDKVFAGQDSLGLKSWMSYALEAGVRDTSAFSRCTRATGQIIEVNAGLNAGRELGISATPTVFLNGWRLYANPSPDGLRRMIAALKKGRSPADTAH